MRITDLGLDKLGLVYILGLPKAELRFWQCGKKGLAIQS